MIMSSLNSHKNNNNNKKNTFKKVISDGTLSANGLTA